MSGRFRILLSGLLACLIGIEPILVPLTQAATLDRQQQMAWEATARRVHVAPLLLTNPDAYLEQEARAATARRDAALAGIEQKYRPAPEVLARAQAEAEAVKGSHALAALLGLPDVLQELDQMVSASQDEAGSVPPGAARLQTVKTLVHAGLEDLDRLSRYEQGRTADQAIAATRLAEFITGVRSHLSRLEQVLGKAPAAGAAPAVWHSYLQELRQAIQAVAGESPQGGLPPAGDRTADPALPTGPLAALPLGPLTALARLPRTDPLVYLEDEKLLTPQKRLEVLVASLAAQLGTPSRWPQPLAGLLSRLSDPAPGDLAETPDVHFTSDITSLIAMLQSNPVALFNYVHDNIDTDLYYGSKKGSTGTLYELSGNDTDQASLLIALLRAGHIPARYAVGRVWLSEQQARDLTRTTATRAAADVLTSAGMPAVFVNRPGDTPVVEIEHTWVQAWLPCERYRGVLEGMGASSWVDLDPFIKRYSFNTPVDLRTAVTFNPDAYLATVTTTLPVDVWENDLRTYVQAHALECTTLMAATRFRTIQPDNLELLPAQLPVVRLNTLDTPSQLPATQRYTMTIALANASGPAGNTLTYDVALPTIYGRRIDLRYPAATPADQGILDQNGGYSIRRLSW